MLTVIIVTLVLHQAELEAGGSFVYQVVPVTLFDSVNGAEYSVIGTITTACDDCVLTAADITAYDVQVIGMTPFNFDETNIGQSLFVDNAEASSTQITIPLSASLSLDAMDNSAAECSDCEQSLSWSESGGNFLVIYSFVDQADVEPLVVGEFSFSTSADVVIATRVPESSGLSLLSMVFTISGLTFARQRTGWVRRKH
jgi:hypothetical protein